MSDFPSISVIIPAFRQADFIHLALDSVADQSYPGNIEVIVIDDESPDDVGDRARAHRLNPRVIRQKNEGVAGARNRGIEEATGEYLAFLDADDVWAPNKLFAQLTDLINAGKPALGFTRYQRMSSVGNTIAEPSHPALDLKVRARKLIFQNFIGTSTVVAHRDCFTRTGGFPTTEPLKRGGQDYALWLRVAAFFPLVYTREILTFYTVHDHNRVGTDPVRHHQAGLEALKDFHQWAPERFSSMAGMSFKSVLSMRTARFVRDGLKRRKHYPPHAIRKGVEASVSMLLPARQACTLD